jgi:hypothetical protein
VTGLRRCPKVLLTTYDQRHERGLVPHVSTGSAYHNMAIAAYLVPGHRIAAESGCRVCHQLC